MNDVCPRPTNLQAVWSSGKVYAVEGAAAAASPTVGWTVVRPELQLVNGGACTDSAAWGAGFDFSVNRTAEWGAAVEPAWADFVRAAANATKIAERVSSAWGTRPVRPRPEDGGAAAARPSAVQNDDGAKGAVYGAVPREANNGTTSADYARQLSRTDVSPFEVPARTRSQPITPTHYSQGQPRLNGLNTYGGFYGWDCWTCTYYRRGRNSYGLGTNGFYVTSKYYSNWSNYNWGYTGLGRVWWAGAGYGGGYGAGGWGGHGFGGINGGASYLNSFNQFGGTGGNGAWAVDRGSSCRSGAGYLICKRRRLQQAVADAVSQVLGGGAAGSGDDDFAEGRAAAVLAVAKAAAASTAALQPVCLASALACAATCPRSSPPLVQFSVEVTQSGVLPVAAAGGLELAAPAVAVGRNGTMLIVATYSGAGRIRGSAAPAFPGEQRLAGFGCCCKLETSLSFAELFPTFDISHLGPPPTKPQVLPASLCPPTLPRLSCASKTAAPALSAPRTWPPLPVGPRRPLSQCSLKPGLPI